MSLADCPNCWNEICTCGHMYEDWTQRDLRKQISMLQEVLTKKINGTEPTVGSTYICMETGRPVVITAVETISIPSIVSRILGNDDEPVKRRIVRFRKPRGSRISAEFLPEFWWRFEEPKEESPRW